MKMRSRTTIALSAMLLAPLTHAQDADAQQAEEVASSLDKQESWSLRDLRLRDATLYWDNDGTFVNLIDNTDRYYTNGLGIEVSFDPNLPSSLKDRLAPAGEWDDPRFGFGVALKQRIFTSEFITQTNPPANDHPYGGYLYFAFSFQRADDRKHDHFGLDLGVVGDWSGAQNMQEFIHRLYPGQDDPEGWDTQLANELAINFNYERTWRSEKAEVLGIEMEMLPALGFEVGNVAVKARSRMTLRAGYNLPNDFGPASFLGHKDHTQYAADWGEGDFSVYFYTTVGIEGVAHDMFLDGNTFADSRSTDSEPFVAMATLGLVARYGSMYAGWAQNFQTETFETQPNGQTFGSLVFGVSFNY